MTCKTSFKFLETLTFKFSWSMVSVLYVEYLPFGLSTNIDRKYSNIFGEILKNNTRHLFVIYSCGIWKVVWGSRNKGTWILKLEYFLIHELLSLWTLQKFNGVEVSIISGKAQKTQGLIKLPLDKLQSIPQLYLFLYNFWCEKL